MSSCEGKSCSTCERRSKGTKDELLECKLSRIKHKIIVMSGKGGVGKSSVAVYIALALAQKGHRVGLMDIDLHGPSIPKMLGLHGLLRISKDQEILPHEYSPNFKVVSIESMLEDTDSAIIWRGPIKHGVIQQFISDCTWNDLDFLVVDCPPGTGDEALSIARIMPDAKAVIVTTPQEVALADVRKSINFCKKVQLDIAGLVENMSGLYCPHCNEFIPIFRTGGGSKTAERMKIDFLGSLPFDPAVVVGGDQGRPILEDAASDSPFRKAVETLADAVVARFERNGAEEVKESQTVH
ncbi:Chromosome partitioning ATPase, Mrp family, contains Fe-S cluster [Desulfacinum hydrothermale DSM 13146]|uniref:Iron-sulfur cluster carrier protein n=1 Tax=Desulfacinum hydrothermale DSM 13146 TaxID=1121390 RepID=A0A1W1XKS6_9BACT|nr:Mrp/NBP35 family ATP-binding protein [Desulfacinum hydrothermale]SMC24108.1 Chromosome partitioning ATPase, Mrp family, contains Fe-S cluster [Desulfacinum hydrothermale DSM 13146]